MKSLTTILIALAICLTAVPSKGFAAMSETAWKPGTGPRLTRIERANTGPEELPTNPALTSLDDEQSSLLDAVPQGPPILEQLVAPAVYVADPRHGLGAKSAATSDTLAIEGGGYLWPDSVPLERTVPTVVLTVMAAMIAIVLRRQIFGAINRLVLASVVATRQSRAPTGSQFSRKRRRRRRSRKIAPDISWYFKAVRTPSQSRSTRRRRRWTSSMQPREYVVTDVVYATATAPTAQPIPRYLLTHSDN